MTESCRMFSFRFAARSILVDRVDIAAFAPPIATCSSCETSGCTFPKQQRSHPHPFRRPDTLNTHISNIDTVINSTYSETRVANDDSADGAHITVNIPLPKRHVIPFGELKHDRALLEWLRVPFRRNRSPLFLFGFFRRNLTTGSRL